MGGVSDFLFGKPSKQKSSSTSSSTSSNSAFDTINAALSPTLGYGAQAGNMMGALLGLNTPSQAGVTPTTSAPNQTTAPSYQPYPTYARTGGAGLTDNGYFGTGGGYGDPDHARFNLDDFMSGNNGYQGYTDGNPVSPASASMPSSQTAGNALETFANSAGMDFLRNQGVKAIESSQAGRGMLQSGATGQALSSFGNNLSKTYLNDYLSHLMDYAGLGTKNAAVLSGAGAQSTSSGTSSGTGTGGKTGLINTLVGATAGNPSLGSMMAAMA